MKQRIALRRMVLCSIGMALGKLDTLKASGGQLTVPLDQWGAVVFERKGKKIVVPVDEIFDAMVAERS